MSRTLEEIMEDVLVVLQDIALRDVSLQLNTDGPVFCAYGGDIVEVSTEDPFDGSSWSVSVVDSNSTIASYVTLVDTTGGPVSLVVPSGLSTSARQPVTVTHVAGDASVSPVTITDEDGASFNGEASISLDSSNASVTFVRQGGNWYVTALYGG